MTDVFTLNRERMINDMQVNLKKIRNILGVSAQDVGELIGVTRQTINNLENLKTPMSATQYVAFCAVLENKLGKQVELLPAINSLLAVAYHQEEATGDLLCDYFSKYDDENAMFLDRWFSTFPEVVGSRDSNDEDFGASKDLIMIAKHYKIFVNYDILMMPEFRIFLQRFSNLLKEYNNKLIIPARVVETLQQMLLNAKSGSYKGAKEALTTLSNLQSAKLITLRGESTDDNLNHIYQTVFLRHRGAHRLMLLTLDSQLAKVILQINNIEAISSYPIQVCGINGAGELEDFINLKRVEQDDLQDTTVDMEVQKVRKVESTTQKLTELGWENVE